ncbi:MAG: hypothetical protein HC904_04485 [Blastochloris sp.]|nr:hypothetical protein [Blastochloris sp.]
MNTESNPTVPQRLRQARKTSPSYLLHALGEQGWVLLLSVVVALIPVSLYLLLQRPTYQAGVSFQMEVTDPSSGAMAAPSAGWALLPKLQSPTLLRDTLARSTRVDGIAEASGFSGSSADLDGLSQHLASVLETKIDPSSGKVELFFNTQQPEAVEAFLPDLIRNFASIAGVSVRDTKLSRMKLLEESLGQAQQESAQAQEKLKVFVEQTQVLDPDGSGKMIQRLDYLNRQLQQVSEDAAQWKLDYEKVDPLRGNAEALLEVPEISNHSTIKNIRRQIKEQETLIDKLIEAGSTEDKPEIVAARLRLEDIEKIRADAALQFPDLLLNEFKKADFLRKQAEERVQQQQVLEEKLKQEGLNLATLKSAADAARNRYEGLLRTQVDAQAAKEEGQAQPLPLEPVALPRVLVGYESQILLWGSFGLGLLIGLILMISAHNRNQRVRTVHEAEQALAVPVIGVVPLDEGIRKLSPDALVQRRKEEPLMEAFRSLRAFVAVSTQDKPCRSFLITSPNPGDGKTSAAVHFALALAQSGKKVLLVDADLRRPSLSREILSSDQRPGLADYALGIDTIENLAVEIIPNLWVLPAGRRIPNPAELLSNAWVADFMLEALSRHEVVVLDSAPINTVGDTVLLLPQVEGVCLVVNGKIIRWNRWRGQFRRSALLRVIC